MPEMLSCQHCQKIFSVRKNLLRHEREQHEPKRFECNECKLTFQRNEHLQKHRRMHLKRLMDGGRSKVQMDAQTSASISEQPDDRYCIDQANNVPEPEEMELESESVPIVEQSSITDEELDQLMEYLEHNPVSELHRKAFGKFLTSYRLKYVNHQIDPQFFVNNITDKICELLCTRSYSGIKLWICLTICFEKATDPAETITAYFCYKWKVILPGSDTQLEVRSAYPEILHNIDNFEKKGSGWVIKKILHADIHFSIYQPLRGSSYRKLPSYLENKHAILNPRNNDNRCFMWAILAGLHPVQLNANRVSNYLTSENDLSFEVIEFPVKLSHIPKFERSNNLSINIYGCEEKDVYPLYISKSNNQHIGLLLYKGHYSLIKDLNKLLYDQNKHKTRKYFCPKCLIPKYSEEEISEHMSKCGGDPTRIEMPKDSELKFTNNHRMLRQPLVIYADFEYLTFPISQQGGNTLKYQQHIPCGYGLVESLSCCSSPVFSNPTTYRGEDCVRKFLLELVQIGLSHQERLNHYPPVRMSENDKQTHNSNIYHICQKHIANDKVRDHCLICGQYRGPAHNECTQSYRLNRHVTVVFHNLRRYDGHLIMQNICEICKDMQLEIGVVAKGMEDYISFSIKSKPTRDTGVSTDGAADEVDEDEDKEYPWKLQFIDSFQFLTSSLEALVSNLDRSKLAMESQFNGEELEVLLRKGVFPYDWLNKREKFSYPLPMKAQFFSKLNNIHITDEDYKHAKEVWQTFSMSNMGQYHDLYLTTDVLLLADVFEGFREYCLANYKLDPAHYMTLPSFGWDACLKMTDIKLQLIQDPEMYTFLESGIRGGISMFCHRYAKANNPMLEEYDASKPKSSIIYLDANNLYGWSMVQSLPTGNFKWVEDVESLDWRTMSDDSPVGCILEVDLKYPEALHDSHNSYPLAPEKLKITDDLLSPYCLQLKETMGLKIPEQEKLVPNLLSKQKYTVHCRNLRFHMAQGLKVTKIHRILSFERWMKPYIEFNTRMRTQARTTFETDLFKLLNNAVFGKTMENVRAYVDVKLATTDAQFRKLAANPRYQYSDIFT